MRLTDLETLAAAVQEGSLTAAARRLFITQPAVSARLRRLEAEVGEPLLRRSGQGVRPTAAGELLYRRAQGLLDEVRRLEQEIGGGGVIQGRLSVGATDLVAIYHLPAALRRFRRDHPLVELAIRVEGSAPLLRLLEEGQVELAVATFPVAGGQFESVPLFRDPLVILAPPGHRLAGGKPGRVKEPPRAGGAATRAGERVARGVKATPAARIDPSVLANEAWISHKPESVTRQLVEGFFAARGIRIRVEMEISNPEAIKKLVQARLGIAALPWCAVRRDVADGRLAVIPVRGFDLERASGLVLRRGAPLGRAAAALRDALEVRPASAGR